MRTELSYKNVGAFFDDIAAKRKENTFLIDPQTNEHVSYGQAKIYVDKTANFLLGLGIKKNEKIAYIGLNSLQVIYVFYACQKIGAVFHPINPELSREELEYVLENSDTVCAFCDEKNREKVPSLPKLRNIFDASLLSLIKEQRNELADMNADLDNESVLMYSSGTTGRPKGIILTQKNILYGGHSIMRGLGYDKKSVLLVNLPLFFSGGLFPNLVAGTCAGACCVIQPKFSKSHFWKMVKKYGVTNTHVVPTMLSYLLNNPQKIEKHEIHQLRYVITSAAACPVALIEEFTSVFGKKIIDAYGLTENTAFTTINDVSNPAIGSIGIPLDIAEMKVVDLEGKEVADGVEGEIIIKGPHIFKEYYKNPEATKKGLKNGWLYSGDLGYRKDHHYYVSGRIKEIIIKGGENISPVAVDRVFYKHKAVMDAATIGVPDKHYGEEVVTYIVLKEGENANEGELLEFCKDHLENFKCPKRIIFTDSIPKGPSGKLLRRELLEKYKKN